MKVKSLAICLSILVFTQISAFGNSAPVVSKVTSAQRNDDSKLVDIYYNLSDADGDNCTIWVVISKNNGQSWDVPAMTFTGQCGNGITPGNGKHIIWDAGRDVPGQSGSFKARISADDGKDDHPMVFVAGGFYPEDGGSNMVFVASYMIGKYELTNAEYAEFLNDADPTSQHWIGGEIARTGSSGSYYYTPASGREQYPIRYASYDDATAYAQWKSQKTGRNYHLPSKYQWQKAAAWDPAQQKFWTYGFQNSTINCSWCNYNGCKGGPISVGYYNGVNPGTNNAVSYYGCYDMSGNVWEWTTEPSGSYRVIRGGTWLHDASICSVTYSVSYAPSSRYQYIGFRVVLDLE